MSNLFDLLDTLIKKGECRCNPTLINTDEIVKPSNIQIYCNGGDYSKILISGTFIDINGKELRGRPMEMDIRTAIEFASKIINACEEQVDSIISEEEDDE